MRAAEYAVKVQAYTDTLCRRVDRVLDELAREGVRRRELRHHLGHEFGLTHRLLRLLAGFASIRHAGILTTAQPEPPVLRRKSARRPRRTRVALLIGSRVKRVCLGGGKLSGLWMALTEGRRRAPPFARAVGAGREPRPPGVRKGEALDPSSGEAQVEILLGVLVTHPLDQCTEQFTVIGQ